MGCPQKYPQTPFGEFQQLVTWRSCDRRFRVAFVSHLEADTSQNEDNLFGIEDLIIAQCDGAKLTGLKDQGLISFFSQLKPLESTAFKKYVMYVRRENGALKVAVQKVRSTERSATQGVA
jgi:hypothetical protein